MRNYIVDRLDNYFGSDYTLNRVPLLIGPSGVAKSALVKEGSKKHDMRLVDIRTAFMSRLDIEGLSEKVEVDGKMFSQSCPMFEFVKCTDEYIRVAGECVRIIDEELENCDEKYKEDLLNTREKFLQESKVPVLIFDEITRGEPSVRQVLTKILTDKEFMGLSMRKARVVAATNSQIDSNGEMLDIYSVNEAYDVAFYDRFESMYVDPSMMNTYWKEWAKKNFHHSVYSMVDNGVCYDSTHFENKDYREAVTTPYRCYRTWEMLSDFYKKNDTEHYSQEVIKGFSSAIIGGKNILSMTDFLNTSLSSGIPSLIISPSGMGKTSRVNRLVKDNNCEMISINLSEVDRLDIEGMPVKTKTLKAMVGSAKITKSIASKITEVFKDSCLPEFCTVRAPKKEYVDKFKDAIETGRKVVIYFDECNRVQNVSVMSAVFSVISDHRLFGVEFNPENVVTILSCNLSDNCSDAQDLDPALCARFAIWKSDEYTEKEADDYRDYINSSEYHPVVSKYLSKISSKRLLESLKTVETRTMEMSASSTRGWEDLSTTLKSNTVPFMSGCVIFSSDDVKQKLSEFIRNGKNGQYLLQLVQKRIQNWSAKDFTDEDMDENGISIKNTYNKILGVVDKITDKSSNLKDFIDKVYRIDLEIQEYRESFFKIFLGTEASDFVKFYNNTVGLDSVSLELVSNMKSNEVKEVVKNILATSSGQDVTQIITELMESIPDLTFAIPERVARVVYQALDDTVDKKRLVNNLSKSSNGNRVLRLLEYLDFYKTVANDIGMSDPSEYRRKIL